MGCVSFVFARPVVVSARVSRSRQGVGSTRVRARAPRRVLFVAVEYTLIQEPGERLIWRP